MAKQCEVDETLISYSSEASPLEHLSFLLRLRKLAIFGALISGSQSVLEFKKPVNPLLVITVCALSALSKTDYNGYLKVFTSGAPLKNLDKLLSLRSIDLGSDGKMISLFQIENDYRRAMLVNGAEYVMRYGGVILGASKIISIFDALFGAWMACNPVGQFSPTLKLAAWSAALNYGESIAPRVRCFGRKEERTADQLKRSINAISSGIATGRTVKFEQAVLAYKRSELELARNYELYIGNPHELMAKACSFFGGTPFYFPEALDEKGAFKPDGCLGKKGLSAPAAKAEFIHSMIADHQRVVKGRKYPKKYLLPKDLVADTEKLAHARAMVSEMVRGLRA